MRQYVSVKFAPGDRRAYTYHNDGPPVAVGDAVSVEVKQGRETKVCTVVEVSDAKPPFDTRAIKANLGEPPHSGGSGRGGPGS